MDGAAFAEDGIAVGRSEGHPASAAGAHAGFDGVARIDLYDVGAQARDHAPDGAGRSTPDLHHGDHGGDADDDAEDRQRGAHHVAPQSLEGRSERVLKSHVEARSSGPWQRLAASRSAIRVATVARGTASLLAQRFLGSGTPCDLLPEREPAPSAHVPQVTFVNGEGPATGRPPQPVDGAPALLGEERTPESDLAAPAAASTLAVPAGNLVQDVARPKRREPYAP